MEIITSHHEGLIFVCLFIGALYSFFLYRKDQLFEDSSKITLGVMAFFRFLIVSVLAFYLLEPLIKIIKREVDPPLVVFAQDNSTSVIIGKDSSFYKTQYLRDVNQLLTKLEENYEVRTYTFGDQLKHGLAPDFTDKKTNFSDLFDEINTRYGNRNLGAVIVASDGIYNTGFNPLYASKKIKSSVFSIALGDTSVQRDRILKDIRHNRLAFLGNTFPLEIDFEALRCSEQIAKVRIYHKGKVVFEKNVPIFGENFFQTIPVQLEATDVGTQKYHVDISYLNGEVSKVNNKRNIYIDVLDGRQKILILTDAPHPDIQAIKSSILKNKNYEVEVQLIDKFNKKVDQYNLAILYQIPARRSNASIIFKQLEDKKIPMLLVAGGHTNFNSYKRYNLGITFAEIIPGFNESGVIHNPKFSLFNLDEKIFELAKEFPPIHTKTTRVAKTQAPLNTLFYQKIGLVETTFPLLAFSKINSRKVGYILGEGLWRWKMTDYAIHKNHDLFNELISKTVQYLASKEDKSKFKVFSKNSFLENEAITFEAEFYNDSYEFYNDPEVSLIIKNNEGNEYSFSFSRTSKAYRLDAGNFPVGEYTYIAKVAKDGKVYSRKGEFTVNAIHIEQANTVANHTVMYRLASGTGGQLIYPSQVKSLEQLINSNNQIAPIIYENKQLSELINIRWIFYVLMAFLALEWFLRKRNGAY